MNRTPIEWTDYTWNPIRANLKGPRGPRPHSGTFCTRCSPGCLNCYASLINIRFGNGLEYTVPNLEKVEFFLDERILGEPLKLKKPSRIFVGDMFDLFHEAIPTELIYRVFYAVWAAPQHTFQLLTKRAQRMRDTVHAWLEVDRLLMKSFAPDALPGGGGIPRQSEPLANCWLGVSVESQKYADERIPLLLQTPAAIRFLSVEPQLEAINIRKYLATGLIHLVIDGGESGPGARPFNLTWAESLRDQSKEAAVAFFMKQMGSAPCAHGNGTSPQPGVRYQIEYPIKLKDRKGGDPSEWPESLRIREFPKTREEKSCQTQLTAKGC